MLTADAPIGARHWAEATKEIVGLDEWFDETNTVEVSERPKRDGWSRVGKSVPDNGIPSAEFLDYTVGKKVSGVSVITETFVHDGDSMEFVRGIVIHVGNESIVFDKGALNRECIWKVTRNAGATLAVPAAEFDPVEETCLSSKTTITRLA